MTIGPLSCMRSHCRIRRWIRLLLTLAGSLIFCDRASSQDIVQRNLLSHFSRKELAASLLTHDQWSPFPRSAAAWTKRIPDSIRRRVIAEGEKYLHEPFVPLPATLYLEFQRNGNRVNYETVSFGKRSQLFALVLAESVEQKGRFTDAIVDGVWSFCEESFWGVPAHYYLQKAGIGLPDVRDPSVDIFASETAEILALTDYFVGPELDSVSPSCDSGYTRRWTGGSSHPWKKTV